VLLLIGMDFEKEYTTQAKIDADLEGIEIKKMILTTESFVVCTMLNNLIKKIKFQFN